MATAIYCPTCVKLRNDHGLRGFSWPEIINYGVHLAIEHKIIVSKDGITPTRITPDPESPDLG